MLQKMQNHQYKLRLQVHPAESIISKTTPITLTAKDVDSLQEFTTTLPFETEYLHKLDKWISKRRFTIDRDEATDRLMVVVEIFSFTLDPVERDEFEMCKEEFSQLQKMAKELKDEMLLFNYSVFGTTNWSDQARRGLVFQQEMRAEMVQSVSNLFDRVDVLGHVDDRHRSYLLSKEQLPVTMGSLGPETVECLLVHDDGVKNEHKIVRLQRNPQNTVNIEEANGINQQYAVYEFAEPLKGQKAPGIDDQKCYSLYVSKIAQVKA